MGTGWRCAYEPMYSDSENFGIVYIEALACGKPVIVARNGGAEEIVTKENEVLFSVGDEEELVGTMKKILDKYRLYSICKIAENCLKKI